MRQGWGGVEAPIHISADALRRHLYVVGQSGTGKSTLLKSVLLQLVLSGQAAALLDPHGDLGEEALEFLPPSLAGTVVYFDLSDLSFPVAWNILAHVPADERPQAAAGIVSAFKHVWGESWGPRLEYILYNALRALLDAEHTTILGLPKLLTDAPYRRWIIRQIEDPFILAFWEDEFERYDQRFRQEAIAPILNKIGPLAMNPVLRNIFGQMKRKLDIPFIMDNGFILIANLSKGAVGSEAASLIGSLLVSEFQRAAMRRASQPESERRDFTLIADEFQSFGTTAFASILSEARKFKLSLVLAQQITSQIEQEVREAVFGNAGTIISFQIGYSDAEIMAKQYAETFSPGQFADLDQFRVLVKPCKVDGSGLPFRARTEPLEMSPARGKAAIVKSSRERFAAPRAKVEERIWRWMERWQGE